MARNENKLVTLVLGGARSGKSRYAQELASAFGPVTFIATARPSDAEMRDRIATHRRERPTHWQTIEVPIHVEAAIREASSSARMIVIDCLTLYLANVMATQGRSSHSALNELIGNHVEELCAAIQSSKASVIIVSNEVGSGIVPAFRTGRVYRDLLGRCNQRVAQIADRVVLMVAGLPLTIKGREAKSC